MAQPFKVGRCAGCKLKRRKLYEGYCESCHPTKTGHFCTACLAWVPELADFERNNGECNRCASKNELKEYHFDLGNSSKGPLGAVAVIRATSKKAALALLKNALPEELEIKQDLFDTEGVEYVNIYFNTDALRIKHITMVDEVEDDEEEEEDDPKEKGSQEFA